MPVAVAFERCAVLLPKQVVIHFDPFLQPPAQFDLMLLGNADNAAQIERCRKTLQGGYHQLLRAQTVELFGQAAYKVFSFFPCRALDGGGQQFAAN